MRRTVVLIILILVSSLGEIAYGADPAELEERKPFLPDTSPAQEAESALRFLEGFDDDDRLFIRLGTIASVPKEQRAEFSREIRIWWRQLTLDPNRRNVPIPVPTSETLFYFDLRSFKWNHAAWRAIAERDKFYREPWIAPPLARRLRAMIGETQPKNFHCIALVDLWALYNRTYHTVEFSDYYDLLFAEQRFVKTEGDDRRIRLSNVGEGGDFKEVSINFHPRKFVDFPKNEKEWLSALLGNGAIKEEDYQRAIRDLKSRRGAVCKGSEDVRIGGSGVARNNRIAWIAPVLTRINAIYGETFDVTKTAGKRDLEENAFTDQDRDKRRVFRDGGELLFSLPAGDGNATLLINKDGDRVEFVPNDIATNQMDARDRRVRNGPMACGACHFKAYGWIPLNNVLEKKLPDEITLNFTDKRYGKKDKQAAQEFDAFFLGWQDDLIGVRKTMQTYWSEATGTKRENFKDGHTGLQIAEWSLSRHHQYKDPLDTEQQCRETGLPEPILRVLGSKLTLVKTLDVARREEITRAAWDEDVFPEIMKLSVVEKVIFDGKLVPLKKEKVGP